MNFYVWGQGRLFKTQIGLFGSANGNREDFGEK
jgi:hypothetical protein